MEEKRTLKGWFGDQKRKVVQFCKDHPDVILSVIGGIASVTGGCIKLYLSKTEYDDYIYTTTIDNEIYKLPAKPVKSAKMITKTAEEREDERLT